MKDQIRQVATALLIAGVVIALGLLVVYGLPALVAP